MSRLVAVHCWLLLVSLVAGAIADEPPAWAKKLPANQWQLIDEHQSGNRINAKVTWLPDAKKLVIAGGLPGSSEREPKRPDRMIYDPASGKWAEYEDEPELPKDRPQLTVMDSANRLKLAIELPEALAELASERLARNTPLDQESARYRENPELPAIVGATLFFDPVHEVLHVIGGSTPGVARGEIGNWMYIVKENAWKKSNDEPFGRLELSYQLRTAARDERRLVAQARNVVYQSHAADADRKKITGELATWQDTLAQVAVARRIDVAGSDRSPAVKAEFATVNQQAETATKAAKAALLKGKIDAETLALAENAVWRCDEGAAILARAPTPRRFASSIYIPERQQFMLFGGDHGDYTLADTWIFDCKKGNWRQIFPLVAPEPRHSAQMFWSSKLQRAVLLAGQQHHEKVRVQRFDMPLSPDVWLFDPAAETWQQAVVPGEETQKKSRDDMLMFMVNNPAVLVDGDVLIVPAVGGNDYHEFLVSSTWMVRLDLAALPKPPAKKEGEFATLRRYRSERNPSYNPQWYDAAPPAEPAVVEKLLAALPTNEWVELPPAPRPCPARSWGTSLYDPTHDTIHIWTGGHEADPADIVHHYHPSLHRWSIDYVAGGGVLGNQLTGRPDCMNHTYKNYAWDPVSHKMVLLHRAGTHVYDPSLRDWTGFTAEQPTRYSTYECKCVGTPRGVVAWTGGEGGYEGAEKFFGLFDAEKLTWTPLPVKGAVPRNMHGDEAGMTWDSKREVLYLHAGKAYETPDGHVHRYDFKTGEMTVLDPANRDTIGDRFHRYRETVYLPDVDLVLFGMGFQDNQQIAYDPAGNRWVRVSIPKTARKAIYDGTASAWAFADAQADDHVGSITFSPVLDTKRNVLWAPSDHQSLFVLKLDPKTLKITP